MGLINQTIQQGKMWTGCQRDEKKIQFIKVIKLFIERQIN